MMMMGGKMTYELDDAQGRAVGSVIRMGGRVMGLPLSVVEVVTERAPPARKLWETQGKQRLLVIEAYRMGFETAAWNGGTAVRVYIDYRLPPGLFGLTFGMLFAPVYARWCVSRMVEDARLHFAGLVEAS